MMSSQPPKPFRRARIDLRNEPAGTHVPDNQPVRTLVELLEHNSAHNPHHLVCLQAKKKSQTRAGEPREFDFIPVTHAQLKAAVVRCCAWLLQNVREAQVPVRSDKGHWRKCAPVAIFMESDLGLLIHELALMSLGIPVLLLSIRLSPEAFNHLVLKTGAQAVLVSPRTAHAAGDALRMGSGKASGEHTEASLYVAQPFETFIPDGIDEVSLSQKLGVAGYDGGESDRSVLVLHSSGTTGLPKPIYQPHKFLLTFVSCHLQWDEAEAQALNLSTLPFFHGFGLLAQGLAFGIGKTMCIPDPSMLVTAESVTALLQQSGAESLMTVPSILEDMVAMPRNEAVKTLSRLRFVAFGGGLLKPSVGDRLEANGVKLLNQYGTTETGPLSPIFTPDPTYDWRYFRLRRDITLEVVPVPAVNGERQKYRLVTYPYGWGCQFEIQDQLIMSDVHPGLDFNAVGRNDALIVLATGEKVNPALLENALLELPSVTAAVAFGTGQFELGVLVQPSRSLPPEEYDTFKQSIWPVITQAGDRMDAHARLSSQDAIAIIPREVLLPRSDKGSLLRNRICEMFAPQISHVYEVLAGASSKSLACPLRVGNLASDIRSLIQTALPHWRVSAEDWKDDDDFFELGMDSLQALQLRRALAASLTISDAGLLKADQIPPSIIHTHSSVTALAVALNGSDDTVEKNPVDLNVDEYARRYSGKSPLNAGKTAAKGAVVLLTGSTGSFGSHLLAQLAQDPQVASIVCLNRSARNGAAEKDPMVRQKKSAADKRVTLSESEWSKVQVIETDIKVPYLGIPPLNYAWLCLNVTHIVHSAWPMDFQRQLHSFEPQFQAMQNLIALSRHARALRSPGDNVVRLVFISSIAVVGQYPVVTGKTVVPEESMADERCANSLGYAKAKLVCERLVEEAAQEPGADFAIVRLGQVAGSSHTGYWNSKEHLPALLQWSRRIGAVPTLDGTLSWIPVDVAASVTREILFGPRSAGLFFQIENPVRQAWHDVMSNIATTLPASASGTSLELIPYTAWIERLRRVVVEETGSSAASAIQLMDFFERDFQHMASGGVVMDTSKTQKISKTLSETRPVSRQELQRYIAYWSDVGLFAS